MLELCSAAAKYEPEAELALARWEELREATAHERAAKLRFHRRAFERARDRALQTLAMRLKPWMLARTGPPSRDGARIRQSARRRRRMVRGASS